MRNNKLVPMMQALLAALLFGASAPIAKILLQDISPLLMASFLYLGCGFGLWLFQAINYISNRKLNTEASLTKKDIPWLLGAIIFGGILAPILQMVSLKITPASTASLLLNFEGVATTMIAVLVFKEAMGKKVWIAIFLITSASVLLSWDFSHTWGLSLGAIGIILACFCWGIDNNMTRNISSKNPFTIVTYKGLAAGSFSFVLSLFLSNHLPSISLILLTMLVGFFCYGFSIVLFVYAMRNMGSIRTSALFGSAPFIGVILSFIFLREPLNPMLLISLPFMIAGAFYLFTEDHFHIHVHENLEHTHRHTHTDEHHNHEHEVKDLIYSKYHSHVHSHTVLEHNHSHLPDIHHRHIHEIQIK